MPHSRNSCYIGPLKDGEMTVLQSTVTTKASIMWSLKFDIQIGIELYNVIRELALNNIVCVNIQYKLDTIFT